ncbi:DUF4129 domain-containing protein [Roseiconus nitratireducens]|uniref:DUF4129 domain-containing protein n=1 Tax=Roseiconus nitratireducens TaxID=2605748 RepID=A0A5M6CXG2_9BACT|nr:DUF4129 domain-containing protein [Roseiconus nitratireducens]KAA5539907.1 DUF4129 domain-containing protein [Roseiconus nitratireducens]
MANRPQAADYAAIGVAPVLIFLMISSLANFFVMIFYQGSYGDRVFYLILCYTMGAVSLARLVIEQDRAYTAGYAIGLGAAALFVMSRFLGSPIFVLGLVLLIGYLADRIVHDCTLIDETVDASGEGLIDRGLDEAGVWMGQHRSARGGQPEATAVTAVTEDAVSEDTRRRRRRSHQPGRTVFLLALAALPLFGIGQFMLRNHPTMWARAQLMLALYLFSSLSLLVTTSFLNLRRYLRQRHVEMPQNVTVAWLAGGIGLVAALLLLAYLAPLPGSTIAGIDVPKFLKTDPQTASNYGWGNEGAEKSEDSADAQSGGELRSKSQDTRGSGQNQNPSGGQSGSGKDGGESPSGQGDKAASNPSGQSDMGGQDSSSGQPSQSQSGKSQSGQSQSGQSQSGQSQSGQSQSGQSQSGQSQSGQSQSGQSQSGQSQSGQSQSGQSQSGQSQSGQSQSGQSQSGESQSGESQSPTDQSDSDSSSSGSKSGDRESDSGDPRNQGKPDADESRDSNSNGNETNRNEGDEDGGRDARTADPRPAQSNEQANSEAPSESSSPSGGGFNPLQSVLPALGGLLRLLIFAVLITIVAVYLYRMRDAILAWWRSLMAGRGAEKPSEELDVHAGLPQRVLKPFSAYVNPIGRESDPRRVVVITFQAFEAWSREQGWPRQPQETPAEFVDRLRRWSKQPTHPASVLQSVEAEVGRMGAAYDRVVYGRTMARQKDLEAAERLWGLMQRAPVPQTVASP